MHVKFYSGPQCTKGRFQLNYCICPNRTFLLFQENTYAEHTLTLQHYMVNPKFSDEELGKNSHI